MLGYALAHTSLRSLIAGKTVMPKIDIAAVPERKGSGYPPPFDEPCAERVRQRLGNAGGLTDFKMMPFACRRAIGRFNATGIRPKTNSSVCSKAN